MCSARRLQRGVAAIGIGVALALSTAGVGVATADTVPPNTTVDLHITSWTTSPRSVTLTWTVAGDDVCFGQATSYCIKKQNGTPITDANWSTAETVNCNLMTNSITISSGLGGSGFWYIALNAKDDANNESGVSNNDCIKFAPAPLAICEGGEGGDVTAPDAVADLHISGFTTNPRSVTLDWSPTGDDGSTGTATAYFVRARLGEPITDSNWDTSSDVGSVVDGPIVVSGLGGNGFWYFACKASDEVCNLSGVSNNDCIKFSPAPMALCEGGKASLEPEPSAAAGSELAITAVQSNPRSEGGPEVFFTIGGGPPATLAVYNAAGRRVEMLDLSHLRPGANSVRVGASLAAGHYWVRLDQGGRTATRDVIVVH